MKTKMQNFIKLGMLALLITMSGLVLSQNQTKELVVGYQQPGKVDVKAFALKSEAKIQLEGLQDYLNGWGMI